MSNSLVFCKGEKKLSKSIVRDKKNNFTKEEITKKKNSINRIVKNIDNRKKRIITDKNEVVDTISDSKIIEMNSIDNNSNIVFNPDCFKVFSIITLDDYEMSVRLKNI